MKFDAGAKMALRQRLGIERMLGDKFSREVPPIRVAVSEAQRLATLAGDGGRVTVEMIDEHYALQMKRRAWQRHRGGPAN